MIGGTSMWFEHKREDVVSEMQNTLAKLKASDPETLKQLGSDPSSTLAGMAPEERRQTAIRVITDSIHDAEKEPDTKGHQYHSRDPLTGIIQSKMGEDSVLPELQATGQGNPVVWIPAGIRGILEHCREKYPFQKASPASRIEIPDQCKVALLSDWGAPNIHAERLGELAIAKGADYIIHMGDIYFSGTDSECQTFLDRWPLRGSDNQPLKGRSFALNGNHEMYSLGGPFFRLVLKAFGQEASYFTLFNKRWQFQALDTAYLPFSISGGTEDARLKVQGTWLEESIENNPDKRNIFLTHNQPVSAHLPEFQVAQPLMTEARQLLEKLGGLSIYAWFFGHEHRCTIYRDDDVGTLFRARLIGNGAIAHHPQEETSSDKDETHTACTPFLKVNSRALDEDNEVAVSTFALLTLNGPDIHVDYIDEDDRIFHSEDWNAEKHLW